MKRYSTKTNKRTENRDVDDFLHDIWAVCEKHNLSLSHEDRHGAFIVERKDEFHRRWLFGAFDGVDRPEAPDDGGRR